MALKAVLTSIDEAPEAIRGEYTERDGKFILNVEAVDGYALEDVTGLKTALGKERTRAERLEKDVVKFKDLDPERARSALLELEELKKIDPASEADKIANTKFEAAKSQLLEKHSGELVSRDDRIGFLSGTVDELVRKQRATAVIAGAKGSVDLLLPHVLANTRTVERDGKFTVDVIDASGNVRIGDAKGNPMTLENLIAEMRQSSVYAPAFEGDGQTGGGKQHEQHRASGVGNFGGTAAERRQAIGAKFGLTE